MKSGISYTTAALAVASSLSTAPLKGEDYTYITNNNTIIITGYIGPVGAVGIPNTINGLPVASIGDGAFAFCSGLTSVTIPNTVAGIGTRAFKGCGGLTSITMSAGVTGIGDEAFCDCGSLSSITIPNSVTSIGDDAFAGCRSLVKITIPNSVTRIGRSAFAACTGLIAITVEPLNAAYTSLDGILFNKRQTVLLQCPGTKSGSYTVPDTVTAIGTGAFYGCKSLTNVTIPNSVVRIGYRAFGDCGNLHIEIVPRPPQPKLTADPLVTTMLHNVQPATLYRLMRPITGEEPVFVGNQAVVFTSRLTRSSWDPSAPFSITTQFAFEHLQALGNQVEYEDWGRKLGPGWSGWWDRNVVGIQPGLSRPEEIVVICAHLDDCSDTERAPGADDNASGSAAVLTAARIFSQYRFERTIQYVLFTGEEQIGLGSQEYVARAVAGGSNIVAVLAPDMIGYASSVLQPPTCRLTLPPPPDLGLQDPLGAEIAQMFTAGSDIEAMFTNVVAAYGLSNTISCSFANSSVASDAEFFFENEYPTLFLEHTHENTNYHTSADTLDTLNFSYLTEMVQAILGTAAHLAHPLDRNPFELLEVIHSDWTPNSDLGGGHFYARLAVEATEANVDLLDLPWSQVSTNAPFEKELRIYSDPYGVWLQTDTRPPGSDTIFRVKLAAADGIGAGVSGNTRLRFNPLTPIGTDRIYLVRVHLNGRYLASGDDFDCVTNLQDVISAGGFIDLPSLLQVPNGAVYGTCDISARLLNQDAANCRLRLPLLDSHSVVLASTAQMGAHIADDLEVCTNLVPPIRWTLLKSYTNIVSPDALHFESGWTEVVREVDASLLPAGTTYFFRLKRTWK